MSKKTPKNVQEHNHIEDIRNVFYKFNLIPHFYSTGYEMFCFVFIKKNIFIKKL